MSDFIEQLEAAVETDFEGSKTYRVHVNTAKRIVKQLQRENDELLNDRDMQVAEKVREACRKTADEMWWQEYNRDIEGQSEIYYGDVGEAIRNIDLSEVIKDE